MIDKIPGNLEDWGLTPEQMELLRIGGERKLTQEEQDQLGDIKIGDTVVISQEALARFAAARAEHGESGENASRDEQQGPPPEAAAGAAPKGGGKAQAGGGGGAGGAGAAASSDDRVDELEREIEDLEEEIMDLQAKAGADEKAQAELRTKRTDLQLKEDELALLQQQGQA